MARLVEFLDEQHWAEEKIASLEWQVKGKGMTSQPGIMALPLMLSLYQLGHRNQVCTHHLVINHRWALLKLSWDSLLWYSINHISSLDRKHVAYRVCVSWLVLRLGRGNHQQLHIDLTESLNHGAIISEVVDPDREGILTWQRLERCDKIHLLGECSIQATWWRTLIIGIWCGFCIRTLTLVTFFSLAWM